METLVNMGRTWGFVFAGLISFALGEELVNVALGKPCNMSTYHERTKGFCNRALNGDTSGLFGESNCVHTGHDDLNPWFEVDLGRSYPVSAITIWARNNIERRMGNCTISVDGKVCYAFPRDTRTLPREMQVKCNQPVNGRRVRITKVISGPPDWDQTLNMCEVEIWSCTDEMWGSQCDRQCGQCLGGQPCDKVTGHCDRCAPGKQPPWCTQERRKMPSSSGVEIGQTNFAVRLFWISLFVATLVL